MPEGTLTAELRVDGLDPLALRVRGFEVEEALSELYQARVDCHAVDPVAVADLLDRPAVLAVEVGGAQRAFHGIVVEVGIELLRDDGVSRVRLVVAPALWRAGLGRSSRLFQGQKLPEVVKALLSEAGVERVRWRLQEAHPLHPLVVQLQESDLTFAKRLLAETGIGFALTQVDEGEELVLFDDSTRLPPIEGQATLLDRSATRLDEEVVWGVRERLAVTSDAVALKDYDLRRPRLELSVEKQVEGATGREVYLHPGGFDEVPEGKRLAQARLERLRCSARVFEGKSSCPRLEPGRTFTLQGHRRTSHNVDHLVVAVRHRGLVPVDGAPGVHLYENAFESIPAATRWRPPLGGRELVAGPQLAFITCPPGEEIHCDEYGRVKALLNFDRHSPEDDHSSEWMRVGQLALGGAIVLPRKDFEVLVDFELGDVDRPLVAGHLYNGEAKPPYALPAGKTRSSFQSATTAGGAGANELRFDDTAGTEQLFLNASKDVSITVQNDASEHVGADQKQRVTGSRTVVVGEDLHAQVAGSRKLTVAAHQEIKVGGTLSDGVGGSESVKVGATRRLEVSGDDVEGVKGTFSRQVAALQAITGIRGLQRKTVGSSTIQVGAAWAELVGGSRSSNCTGDRTERTGGLKLVKAKSMSVTAGQDLGTRAAILSTRCGGGRTDASEGLLAITAGGGLGVKAETITIEAEVALTLVAGPLKLMLLSAGVVLLSGGDVDLRGVKELTQVLELSN